MAHLKDLIVTGVSRFIGKVYASEFVGKLTGNADTATNATKVNGHTVNSDVPANAKFTDTTYSVVTTSENGLMSYSDKTKLDGMVAITTDQIDAICSATIYAGSEVSV